MDIRPLIVAVAPNGAYKAKADHPALPMTSAELADTAARCLTAGAAMIHLHVRGPDGGHTLDPDIYRAAIAAIREAVGDRMVIQVTSESGGIYQPREQMQAIREVSPEAVSLALRELLPGDAEEHEASEFFHWLAGSGCVPQYILYSPDEVVWYHELLARGVIPDRPHWVLFVLGRYTSGQQSEPTDLVPFLGEPTVCPWGMCAFGPSEHACAVAATALGGHVRVGFENNLYLKDGTRAADNAALITQVSGVARMLNRPLLDADGLRRLLE